MKDYKTGPATFKNSVAGLKKMLQELEAGGLTIEESLEKYRKARKLSLFCAGKLNEAQKKAEGILDGKIT